MTPWLLVLAMAGSAGADPAPAEPSPAEASAEVSAEAIRSLVFELDSPQRAVRDAAEKRLIEFGPPALTHLPEAATADTAEAAARLRRIRQALYRARVEQSVRESLVTLEIVDAPLSKVLDEITRQTGNRLIDYRRQFGQKAGDGEQVTLRLDKKPFWPALDEFLAAQRLKVYPFSGEDGLALVSEGDRPARNPFVAYSGAFRVEVVELTSVLRPGSPTADLKINLTAAWEPRLKPMFLTVAMGRVSATVDTDAPLAVANPELKLEIPPQGKATLVQVPLAFVAPPRTAAKIARLRGTLDVLLPAEQHEFRFRRLDGPRQSQEAAAVSVTVEQTRINMEMLEVPIRLSYDNAGNALESHRAWFYKNPAYLESPDGKRVSPGMIELARQSDNEVVLNLLFEVGDNWRDHVLVYRTPADIVTVPIEFEFRDLPLP